MYIETVYYYGHELIHKKRDLVLFIKAFLIDLYLNTKNNIKLATKTRRGFFHY